MQIQKDLTQLMIKRAYGSVINFAADVGVTRALVYAAIAGERGTADRDSASKRILERLEAEGLLLYTDSSVCQQLADKVDLVNKTNN